MSRKTLLFTAVPVLVGAILAFQLWQGRGLPRIDRMGRDYRYDDTVSLQLTVEAMMAGKFDEVEKNLRQMMEIEKSGGHQSPFLAFLSIAGDWQNYDRCVAWNAAWPESAFAWLCLGDALNNKVFLDHSLSMTQDVKGGLSSRFTETQLESERCYRKAEELDPDFAYASACLIGSDLVLNHRRDIMEKHFKDAIRKDPDCLMAYLMKAEYLKARWYGSWEIYTRYVRETASQFPYATIIPVSLIMNYHLETMVYNDDTDHFMRPEVWAEVKDLMEKYLKANPTHHAMRSLYLKLAITNSYVDIAMDQAPLLLNKWGPLAKWGTWKGDAVYYEMVEKYSAAAERREENKKDAHTH